MSALGVTGVSTWHHVAIRPLNQGDGPLPACHGPAVTAPCRHLAPERGGHCWLPLSGSRQVSLCRGPTCSHTADAQVALLQEELAVEAPLLTLSSRSTQPEGPGCRPPRTAPGDNYATGQSGPARISCVRSGVQWGTVSLGGKVTPRGGQTLRLSVA